MDISVITPFYKGNQYMEQLFGCIRRNAQNAPELAVELILVNDSPDCQIAYDPDWVKGFQLKILQNPQNAGIHRSRANGLSQAQGTFIQFLDQDDLLADEAFASQFPLAQDADVVVANGFDQSPNSYGPIYKSISHQQQATLPRFYYSLGNMIVSPGHCLIRKSAIPEIWQRDYIRRNGSDDLLLWLLMFYEKRHFVINPALLYTHVETGVNVSADDNKILSSSFEVLEYLQRHNMICPEQLRQFTRSRTMAQRYANKPKAVKLLYMLAYPDVAWEKVALTAFQKNHKNKVWNPMDLIEISKSAQLDLLIELKRICEKNNIPYFLSEGTLIGAIRHQGFIPWDDDLDVGMLREHYNRFREACETDLDPAYMLLDWHSDPYSPLPFMKLKIRGSHYREEIMGNSKANDSIFIDIFPFDNVSPSAKLRRRQKQLSSLLFKIILVRCGYRLDHGNRLKALIYGLLRILSCFRSVKAWKKSYSKLQQQYNDQPTEYVDIISEKTGQRFVPISLLETTVEHTFEGRSFSVPQGYDAFLRRLYGDYMQLPPEDQRTGCHNVHKIDLGSYTIRCR